MKVQITLGDYEKEVELSTDLATCLEYTLAWGSAADDNVDLIRVSAAAIGVALDKEALLPKYRPEKDKILAYGRKVLERLLLKTVPMNDIFTAGSTILSAMSKAIPQQKEVEEKKDFFHSAGEET